MQIGQGAIVLAASLKLHGMAVDQLVDRTHVGAELSDVANCAGFPWRADMTALLSFENAANVRVKLSRWPLGR